MNPHGCYSYRDLLTLTLRLLASHAGWKNRIYDRSPMQTEKSQPEDKRIMLETRFTKFPALSVDLRVGISRSSSETDVYFSYL